MKWREPPAALSVLLLVLATLLCLLPFIQKPVHMDDPLFIWTAAHIHDHPTDFYGFEVNWDGHYAPMDEITKNPPLASYYMALVGAALGWTEEALHFGFILSTVALVLGTYALARRLCANPLLAALATLATPVVIVSGTTLMCDTLMAAFWVWAVFFWMAGLEGRPAALALAAVLIIGSSLSKYFGIALVPLLFTYTIYKKRRFSFAVLWLLVPVMAIAAYDFWTSHKYHAGLLSDAAKFSTLAHGNENLVLNVLTTAAFLGGCTFLPLAALPLLCRKRGLGLSIFVIGVLFLVFANCRHTAMFDALVTEKARWLIILHLAVFVFGGGLILALAGRDAWTQRSAESVLLFLWVVGVFIFVAKVNWTIAARNILPAAPAVALLVVRRIEQRQPKNTADDVAFVLWPIGATAAVAVMLAWADTQLAVAAKGAAGIVAQRFGSQMDHVWFEGHWGFQYYLQPLGARPLDALHLQLHAGDLIVAPKPNRCYEIPLPADRLKLLEGYSIEMPSWCSVLSIPCGAGYYSDYFGPSPFIFGLGVPEQYVTYKVTSSFTEHPMVH